MSEKPISELRRRMLEDMAVRKFGEKTRHDYIRHIAAFAKFLGRSPDTATAEDVRRFQVHLTESGARPPKLNSATSRCVSSLAPRSIGLSSPGISPACITRDRYRVCSHPRRCAVCSKQPPVRASSTRRL